jgi:hypothetical protein
VKIGDGPAAVTGDENRSMSLPFLWWEGAASRMIRKSENLPESVELYASADRGVAYDLEDKKGHPRIDESRSGDFFCPDP